MAMDVRAEVIRWKIESFMMITITLAADIPIMPDT